MTTNPSNTRRAVLKNVEAGPVKSAIVVTFCINLILAYEVKNNKKKKEKKRKKR